MSHLLIIDGSSFVHRAYHVAPDLVTSKGVPVGAVHGFARMLFNLMTHERTRDYTHAVVAFDLPRANWRHAIDPAYKGSRFSKSENLTVQFEFCQQCVTAFGMTAVDRHGFEADDIIASYVDAFIPNFAASTVEHQLRRVTIVSSDKDLMQLVTDRVVMLDTLPKPPKVYRPMDVETKFGVPPKDMAFALAMAGDESDHIPGIPGVGFKTVAKWIRKYGSATELMASLSPDDQRIVKHNLRLVTLRRDVQSLPSFSEIAAAGLDMDRLLAFLDGFEFVKLKGDILAVWGVPEAAE